MKAFNPQQTDTEVFHHLMMNTVAPRPIAFVSSVSAAGVVNLSPFSFFSCFPSKPPVLVFSPARHPQDKETLNTLRDAQETGELVINIGNFGLVEQMALTATPTQSGIDEFKKVGLSPIASTLVKPPRVAEVPAAFECRVLEVKPLNGIHLIFCEILLLHVRENMLDNSGRAVDPTKWEGIARMGGDWYLRVTPERLFELPRFLDTQGMGIYKLPAHVLQSKVLTGSNLARLASLSSHPTQAEVQEFATEPRYRYLMQTHQHNPEEALRQVHLLAKRLLEENRLKEAWMALVLATPKGE